MPWRRKCRSCGAFLRREPDKVLSDKDTDPQYPEHRFIRTCRKCNADDWSSVRGSVIVIKYNKKMTSVRGKSSP